MSLPPQVFWPYAAGAAALVAGAIGQARRLRGATAGERLLCSAPILVAVGMAVFGADHLTEAAGVATIVPRWIPWHLFWAYFVGVALEAAALSLCTGLLSDLASGLLGVMLICFALTIFVPFWLQAPGDRTRLTLLARDFTLGTSYLAFALRLARARIGRGLVVVGRLVAALGMGTYGLLQCLHPEMAPGIPQDGPNLEPLPAWIPAHAFWTYLSGGLFLLGAVGLLVPKWASRAAFLLGTWVAILVIAAYLPITIEKGANVEEGLNYLAIHCALAGAMLLLSAALAKATKT
jgi:uncharacterized membrane protein